MKFTLKDYQTDAVGDVLQSLAKAKRSYTQDRDISSVALTATTGAGKTVMAAAVIETLFGGNEDFNFEPDKGAVVLWFSDDPSLNEQTRFRLLEASDRIGHANMVVVQNTFNQEKFDAGKVYFLNSQKLGKSSLLVRGHVEDSDAQQPGLDLGVRPDLRSYTIWDTIRNTIEDPKRMLYLVLDEAHRGMGRTAADATNKSTIVKKLINGQTGIPAVPVVWGISATVERFETAMRESQVSSKRITWPRVEVDAASVQESGLLKDTVLLDIPKEAGQFDTVLLRRATRRLIESTFDWDAYGAAQVDAKKVVPLMVIQSPNTPSPEMIKRALDTVFDEWKELRSDAVAHVFGDHVTMRFGDWVVPYISPERVQESAHIRVLLAKDAVSTGWDCPRAEVLMSFRPAQDRTHITQLLGRMVRTPLARRVPGNERLNSVSCILPYFDHTTAIDVVRSLMGADSGEENDSGGGPGRKVVIEPTEMRANPEIPEDVWNAFENLPTQMLPKRGAKPVKRLTALAQALATDQLKRDAGKVAHAEMHGVLDGLIARFKVDVDIAMKNVLTVQGETVTTSVIGMPEATTTFVESADDRSIEVAFRAAGRALSPDIARTYVRHLAGEGDSEVEDEVLREAHAKVAALSFLPEIKDALEREAEALAVSWLSQYRVAIKGLSDERRAVYNDIQAMAGQPQRIFLARPKNRLQETKGVTSRAKVFDLPTRTRHLLSDEQGNFPVGGLNEWELKVLDSESTQPGFIGWYRNPSSASDDSLSVAYRTLTGTWSSMRPDFLFFSRDTDAVVRASIIDPHGHHLADALLKLQGLALFAEQFSDEFHRIESVTELNGVLRVLDLTRADVRKLVATCIDLSGLYLSDKAADY